MRHALPPPGWLPDIRSIAASLFFLDDRVALVNGSFWTLMVEFRWYFAFPLLLWLWVRSPRAFLAAGIASLVLYHFTRARALDFGTLPGFMLGIIAADLHVRGPHTAGWGEHLKRWSWLLAAAGIALGVACQANATIPGYDRTDVTFAYQPTIFGWQLGCFALVVFAGANAAFRRLLSVRALVATGVASYGIYLVHEPIVAAGMARFTGVTERWRAAPSRSRRGSRSGPPARCRSPRVPCARRCWREYDRGSRAGAETFAGIGRTIEIRPAPQTRGVVTEDYASSRFAVVAPSSPT